MMTTQQQPVRDRDIDLAALAGGRLPDVHPGQVVELNGLLGERIGPRDGRLRRDYRRRCRQCDQRVQRPIGGEQVERIVERVGLRDQQRALPEIVERQRRKYEAEPRDADRRLAEVPHVGIERFGAGERQQHRPKHDERRHAMLGQEAKSVEGIERAQDLRMHGDPVQSEHCDGNKPEHRDRPEQCTHYRRALSAAM